MNPTVKQFEVSESNPIKGYKAIHIDGKERYTDGLGQGTKILWEKNKVYSNSEDAVFLCKSGFHFCKHLPFVVNFFDSLNKKYEYGKDYEIWECEAWGKYEEDTFKVTAQHIKLLRRVSKKELKKALDKQNNSGYGNSGHRNSGHRNSGDWNSGYGNSGNRNSGDWNSGNLNSGNWNSGNRNSGDWNSGHRNSGYGNSGNRNSGDWNSGYGNSGNYNRGNRSAGNFCFFERGYQTFFCKKDRVFLFDIEIEQIPQSLKTLGMSWFDLEGKSYEEAWEACPDEVMEILRSIPEFQTKEARKTFKAITGRELG